jgi:hypothetical protein
MSLRMLIDTHKRRYHWTQVPKTALDPFEDAQAILDGDRAAHAAIKGSRELTRDGKAVKSKETREASKTAVKAWGEPRLVALDREIAPQDAANKPAPLKHDAARVAAMADYLRRYTPLEVAIFYGSASGEEKLVMEAAAVSVGRVPVKSAGGLTWQPLLDPAVVQQSTQARITANNPIGAQKLAELQELRDLTVTIMHHAIAELDAVDGNPLLEGMVSGVR